jgi:hypothetical protein
MRATSGVRVNSSENSTSEKLDTVKIDAALKRAARKALHGTQEERSRGFTSAPKAFISYSHESAAHKDWVLKLGSDLRAKGIDVVLDQWDIIGPPGQMETSIFFRVSSRNNEPYSAMLCPHFVTASGLPH